MNPKVSDISETGIFKGKLSDGKCRILALDGGGAKGFYTLGVLEQIELMLGKPLHECFDYVRSEEHTSELQSP